MLVNTFVNTGINTGVITVVVAGVLYVVLVVPEFVWCVFFILFFLCLYFFEGLFFVRCFRVSCVFFFAVSLGVVVFVCVFGGAGVSLGVVVCLSFRAFLGVLFLRVSLAVVLALLFVNYVAGFLAFCRIYI